MILILRLLLVFAILASGLLGAAQPARADDLKEQVRQILRENPELVLQVIKENKNQVLLMVQEAAQEQRKAAWKKRIAKEMKKPFKPVLQPGRLYIGPLDATYNLVAYSNFMCGHCATGDRSAKQFTAKHPKEVRMLVKHVARDDLAKKLALYFLAIGRQDPAKAWEYSEKVFASQKELKKKKEEKLQEIVSELKLDQKQLFQDLADPELSDLIKADTAEHDKFEFHSTPTFLLNGVSIRGSAPPQAFEEILAMLKAAKK